MYIIFVYFIILIIIENVKNLGFTLSNILDQTVRKRTMKYNWQYRI